MGAGLCGGAANGGDGEGDEDAGVGSGGMFKTL